MMKLTRSPPEKLIRGARPARSPIKNNGNMTLVLSCDGFLTAYKKAIHLESDAEGRSIRKASSGCHEKFKGTADPFSYVLFAALFFSDKMYLCQNSLHYFT